jgi:hypothetical protein
MINHFAQAGRKIETHSLKPIQRSPELDCLYLRGYSSELEIVDAGKVVTQLMKVPEVYVLNKLVYLGYMYCLLQLSEDPQITNAIPMQPGP